MIPIIDVKETGWRIQSLIRNSEYSVRDISEMLGFETPQAIYKWMHGESLPKIDNLVGLAKILDVRVDDILIIK